MVCRVQAPCRLALSSRSRRVRSALELVVAEVGPLAQRAARVLPRPVQLDAPDLGVAARVELAEQLLERLVPGAGRVGRCDLAPLDRLDRVDRKLADDGPLAPTGAGAGPVPATKRERDLAGSNAIERAAAEQHVSRGR